MLEGTLAYIGIGSNLGNPLLQCKASINKLSDVSGITLERVSSFYKTEPVIADSGIGEQCNELENQSWFINAVAEIRTTLVPGDLLKGLQNIEKMMGRVRTFAGAPRTIDLDILLYGQEIMCDVDLIIPHPEMHKRLFVLVPLCEIASHLIHPAFGVSMRGLKDRLNDQKIVELYPI
ncbi:MAG: 2-amino-4-hydroxy-6-hydroxymethyldihydropteridine diphosphokinase [Smithella sp.]|jgi:2-amino-4-hydroxy-6-hydroxymethyldihydropteridine diphosphokinase